jgi:hypothetical protein
VVHTQGVRPGAGQITISYQLILESEPTPPSEETTAPPVEEPVSPPTEEPVSEPVTEEPPTTEPTVPNVPEPESVNSDPSGSEQQVTAQPEPIQAPAQEPTPAYSEVASDPVEELVLPIAVEVITNEPRAITFEESGSVMDGLVSTADPLAQDEIIQQPTNLRQAAQTAVVPVQNKQTPWSSNSLFAGLIGLGVFALIAGLVVARRGVPGAIAS